MRHLRRQTLLAYLRPLLLPLLVAACTPRPTQIPSPALGGVDDVDRFFEEALRDWVRDDPEVATTLRRFSGAEQERLDGLLTDASDAFQERRVQQARHLQDRLKRFDRPRLTSTQRLAADVLAWSLDDIVRGQEFLDHRYPFHQYSQSPQSALPTLLTDLHPMRGRSDAQTYLRRLAGFGAKFDQAIAAARARQAKRIVPPRFILDATIEQMRRFTQPAPAGNVLYTSLADRLQGLKDVDAAERARLLAAAASEIRDTVYPAYRRAITVLDSQRAQSTEDAGLWRLPRGAEAYAYFLRSHTTTELTPDQVHERGLQEVARLEKEMDAALRNLGHTQGTVEERFDQVSEASTYADGPDVRARVLADYQSIVRDADARAAAVFDLRPRARVEVRRIAEFRERNAAANYVRPPLDGSRPGLFNVPLAGPRFQRIGMRTQTYHEAVPGHHFQRALQVENTALPAFLRNNPFSNFSAFSEGWALYAERLVAELGWYDGDPVGDLGRLHAELFRARRLVVDTGLHARRWTRAQAIAYGVRESEVDRYVVVPGQACAYKIGQMKMLGLRERARAALGTRFDLKAFHNQLLSGGAVPLDVLDGVVAGFIDRANARR